LLSIEDAAEYLGISAKTIRNRLGRRAKEEGREFPVKPRKYGKRRVFNIKDLDKFADSLPPVDY
jgi:transposase